MQGKVSFFKTPVWWLVNFQITNIIISISKIIDYRLHVFDINYACKHTNPDNIATVCTQKLCVNSAWAVIHFATWHWILMKQNFGFCLVYAVSGSYEKKKTVISVM